MNRQGFVALVGAGPGGRELLTVKGEALLKKADVVVYDRLISQEILEEIPMGAKHVDVGKTAGNHPVPQGEINEILVREAEAGNFVVRLKGGDPFVFGRGGEELCALVQKGIPFTVVPGVSSATGAACYAGIPVTHRDACSSLHIITGHVQKDAPLSIDYQALTRLQGTLIFLMGVSSLPELMDGLLSAGMEADTPAAVVENGARPEQRKIIATVGTLAHEAQKAAIHSPAVILVGKVCAYSGWFDWFERLPLRGKTLVVTRPKASSGTLAARLRELGANVICHPCIETERLPWVWEKAPDCYQWLLFTSKNGVDAFFERLFSLGKDARVLSGAQIGAVGRQTASALRCYGVLADCVPKVYDGEHLAELVKDRMLPGEKALIVGPEQSSGSIERVFEENSVSYDYLPLYRTKFQTEAPKNAKELLSADGVVFTSASAVEGFARSLHQERFLELTAYCIGKQTAMAAEKYGMNAITAEKASAESLVECVAAHLK